MRQTELGEKYSRMSLLQQHQQLQNGGTGTAATKLRGAGVVAATRTLFIDTPGRMALPPSNKQQPSVQRHYNYFTANKVELIDLERNRSTSKPSTVHQSTKVGTTRSPIKPSLPTKHQQPSSVVVTKPPHQQQPQHQHQQQQQRCLSLSPQLSLSSSFSSSSSTSSSSSSSSPSQTSPTTTTATPLAAALSSSSRNLINRRSSTIMTTMNRQSDSTAATAAATAAATYEYLLVDPKKIHLFVKAGQDGRSQGACPFCQDVFLQLLIKAQTNKFNFDVISINLDNPPKEFKELCIKPPVLIHGSTKLVQETIKSETSEDGSSSSSGGEHTNAVILSDVDEIAEYLDKLYSNSRLTQTSAEAKRAILNVFSKFSYFIRDISSKSTALEAELEKIDAYLRENCRLDDDDDSNGVDVGFLNGGTTMTKLDCSLLPKLQHIRVAGESIKKFRIPYRFRHLWMYMRRAYETDAFQKSCPPDREIIWHWSKAFLTHKDMLQIMNEAPYKTHSLPPDLNI